MFALATHEREVSVEEVGDDPVLFSKPDRIDAKREQLAAAKPASDHHGED